MPHAFISYVRENKVAVDRLARDLENGGVTVWLDRNNLEPGSRWRDAIKKAIRNGKFFLACFSNELNERERSYMHEELTLAIDELRSRPLDTQWFIPITIDDCKLPTRPISQVEDISDLQSVSLYEDWSGGVQKILRVLHRGDPVQSRVEHLAILLRNSSPNDREYALKEISKIGSKAVGILSEIVEVLSDTDPQLRSSAAAAIGSIGPEAVNAAPRIAEALTDKTVSVRMSAAYAIQRIGPSATDAVPKLIEALQDPDARVRTSVAYALRWVCGPESVSILGEALAREDTGLQTSADIAGALGSIGSVAVPELIKALQGSNTRVRCQVASALANMHSHATAAVPALTTALSDRDSNVRASSAQAIGQIAVGTAGAVPALSRALQDPDTWVRWNVAEALERIGPDAADAVPALMQALQDQNDPTCRWKAADALGSIGWAAIDSTPALVQALEDRDELVRQIAARSLNKLNSADRMQIHHPTQ